MWRSATTSRRSDKAFVRVFDIEGHPTVTPAYAWSLPFDGSDKRRFNAVLHLLPVSSQDDAVRAAIVADYRKIT